MFPFGVDYYPEQWPAERWQTDARLMAEAGFNLVRLADFAWSKLEPEEGRFDFSWLDAAIQILSDHGLRVVLATPTASPPPWLMHRHPEVFRVREDGLSVTFGNRREYCPNQPVYHEYTRKIVRQMADHYSGNAAVIGWQLDNEVGDRCYCPACREAFQTWLRQKYGSLDTLNQKWGTIFWSHVYTAWEQIPVPLKTGGTPNPGLALDFDRFASDSYAAYLDKQAGIIREKCPGHFVTHDCMGFAFDQIDYFKLARNLDFACLNYYPRSQWNFTASADSSWIALQQDTMRGLKQKNYWVTEQQAGQGGWEYLSVTPRPGELRLWAYQAIAHGADAILFFRWRTARFGTEQFWYGLLDYDGHPGRRYQEIKQMGAEIQRIAGSLQGSLVKARAACILSYDSRFAFQIQPHNPGFSYPAHFHEVYAAFHRQHIPIDIISPEADLSGYALVVAPSLYVLPKETAGRLVQFVQNGGVLLLTQRSGVKDPENAVVDLPLPGLLAELCGVRVVEVDSLAQGMSNSLEFCLPGFPVEQPPVGVLCEILEPRGAQVVARYTRDFYSGQPAITHHRFGKGHVVYLGTVGDKTLYAPIAKWILAMAGLDAPLSAPEAVEVSERWQDGRSTLFLLNPSAEKQQVRLDTDYLNLLDGQTVAQGAVDLAPYGVFVLIKNRTTHLTGINTNDTNGRMARKSGVRSMYTNWKGRNIVSWYR